MRSLSQVSLLRLACAFAVSTYVTFGVVGCGESAPPTGTNTQLAPEAVKANNSMEEFVKSQKK